MTDIFQAVPKQENKKAEKDDLCELPHFHGDKIEATKLSLPDDDDIISLADIFKLLADMSRLKLIFALLDNELCVCDICHVAGMSQSAISHQLRVLRAAHLVKYRKDGKLVYYSIDDSHVSDIIKLAIEHQKHN